MNKTSTTPLKTIDLNEEWNDSPIIEWLSTYKKTILWAFIALIAVLMIAYQLAVIRTSHAERDFFRAQNLFTQFQASLSSDDHSTTNVEELEAMMQRYPELKAKYEGPLAQTLLILGQTDRARPLAEDLFKRTQPDHLQLYQEYSQTSLLISKGQYAEALQQAQQLKRTLDQAENEKVDSTLYLFNLIRLALLYQELGQPQEELQAWEQLQSQNQLHRLKALAAIHQALKIGQVSLDQYIEERKRVLNLPT